MATFRPVGRLRVGPRPLRTGVSYKGVPVKRVALLSLLLAACDDPAPVQDEAPVTGQQAEGFTALAPEPTFNGGFESRNKGQCYTNAGRVECEVPTGLPDGWTVLAPHALYDGVFFRYGTGRNPAPALPGRSVPDASTLVVAPCVPGSGLTIAKDGCVGRFEVQSSAFPVVADTAYSLSAWFRSELWWDVTPQRNGLLLQVVWFDAGGAQLRVDSHDARPDSAPLKDWTEDDTSVTAPTTAATARVRVSVAEMGNRFLYVDDVRLIPE